jgi:hypothetical protein
MGEDPIALEAYELLAASYAVRVETTANALQVL